MKRIAKVLLVLLLMAPWAAWSQAESSQEGADRQEAIDQQLAEARAELAEAARKLARIQRELIDQEGESFWREVAPEGISGEPFERIVVLRSDAQALSRPRLGLILGAGTASEGDVVIAVTPGGGAERAGVRAGDRVVAINNQAADPDDAESIQQALAGIEPGDRVPVEIERDGELLTFEVEASDLAGAQRTFVRRVVRGQEGKPGEIRREALMVHPASEQRPRFFQSPPPPRMRGLQSNAQLAGNHAGLEPYFGTAEGVIVLKVDEDNSLGLESGDVILSVDGRRVARPMDVGMALIQLEVGEPVSLEVVRAGNRKGIQATVPDGVVPGSWSGGLR